MPRRVLRRSRHHWFTPLIWKRRLVLWGGAIIVGIVAALFAKASEYVNVLFHQGLAFSPWLPVVVTPVGLALAVLLTRRVFPGSQGSGIPQAIAALQVETPEARGKLLSLRIAAGKILVTLFALGSGASVGREGPTVQVSASIIHALGKVVRFPRRETQRGLILAGGAAGIAAAFNTPLAGIVFAIEELSRSFEERTSGTIVTTVIVSGIASIALLGNYIYFGHTDAYLHDLNSPRTWAAILACGLSGGVLGGIFSRTLILFANGLPGRIGAYIREHPVIFAFGCGIVLVLVGYLSGNTTFGSGYSEAKGIVEGNGGHLPATYGILKLLATIASYVSGIPGGIFAPSLAVGAGLGSNLSSLMPGIPTGAMVLLGMVSFFAGGVQAPITAFVIVMEMTDNQAMIVPLMAASFIAYGASRLICPKPLYKSLSTGFLAAMEEAPKPLPAPEKQG